MNIQRNKESRQNTDVLSDVLNKIAWYGIAAGGIQLLFHEWTTTKFCGLILLVASIAYLMRKCQWYVLLIALAVHAYGIYDFCYFWKTYHGFSINIAEWYFGFAL